MKIDNFQLDAIRERTKMVRRCLDNAKKSECMEEKLQWYGRVCSVGITCADDLETLLKICDDKNNHSRKTNKRRAYVRGNN